MNSQREQFLKSLKVTNTSSNKRKNRYIADIKAEEMAKKQGLRKKVAALIMAGGIIGVSSAAINNYFDKNEPQQTTNPHQIEMVNENQNTLPAEIYLPRKAQYDQLQRDIAEYKKLDSVIFKNDDEKKRFAELQSILTEQHEFIEKFSLDLIKYKVAKDHGIERYSDLEIKPSFEDGEEAHYVRNKRTNTNIICTQLNKPTLSAITNISNFQFNRDHKGKYIPLNHQFEIIKHLTNAEVPKASQTIDNHSKLDTEYMSEIIVHLNDKMIEFNKTIDKSPNIKKIAMKKDDGMER